MARSDCKCMGLGSRNPVPALDTPPEQEDPGEVERPAGGALDTANIAGSLGCDPLCRRDLVRRNAQGASVAGARAGNS